MATKQAVSGTAADSHDLIRVQGARENNLKDVSVELPKRRLTAFTGVSGSGKSSLVFSTIAAESQRMINETYSAFVQGFMPNLSRPEVDLLEGLTTAIIVDQERMGANPRSTVGTATDAYAMLRILFSRIGTAARRRADGVLLQRPDPGRERRHVHREGWPDRAERRPQGRLPGRHVPDVRGHGRDQRLRPHRASTTSRSRSPRAPCSSRATAWTAGTAGSSAAPAFDMDKPIGKYTKKELDRSSSTASPRRSRSRASTSPTRACSPRSRSRCSPRTSRRCSRTSGASSSAR